MKYRKITLLLCLGTLLAFAQAPVKLTIRLGGGSQNETFRASSGLGIRRKDV
ncbi:MAG: hypothetical protein U5N56_08530 [Candidatus Marinimicrobia bacterium]|nr:hypothetical protein [Candidatus Neomarinimicrobiota bacterium]